MPNIKGLTFESEDGRSSGFRPRQSRLGIGTS